MSYQPKYASKQKIQELQLPDGSPAWVRKLPQGVVETIQRQYYGRQNENKGQEGFRYVACQAACDAEGNRTWADGDMVNLVSEDADVIQALAQAALEFNGLTKRAEKPEEATDPKA